MKFEIMLAILLELLEKRYLKAQDLADKYEVSLRSIYRYISSLECAGVPIYSNRGNGGGFGIIDTYKISSTFFTVKEMQNIVDTLSAITESIPNKDLENVIQKLKSSKKSEFSRVEIKRGNLIIDAGPWGDTRGYKTKLAVIQKSLDENLELQIKYHDRNGSVTERIIHPHVILFKQGLWYVYAYCTLRNEFRFFMTGRIESANILKTSFTRQDISQSDLPLDFWHNSVQAEEILMEIGDKYLSDIE